VAVPADQGATFNIAMNQAYKSFREEEDDIDIEDLEPEVEEQMPDAEMRKMIKKNHPDWTDEEIEKAMKMKKAKESDQTKSDSSIIERRENMEENKTENVTEKVEEKVEAKADRSAEMKAMSEEIASLKSKITEMESKKIKEEEKPEEPKEEPEEEETTESYKIVQGVGSLKGGSFTMIKNKY
jgi:hypothetical protein